MVKVVVVDNHKGLHYGVDTRMEVFLYVEDVDPLDLWIYLQKLNGTKVLTSFLWRVCSCDELVFLLDCSFSANDPTLKGENGFKMGYLLRLEKMLHLSLVHVSRSDYATGTAAETPADVLEKIEKEKDDEVDLTDEGHVRNGMREKEKKKLIKLSHLFTHLLKSIKAKNKLVTGKGKDSTPPGHGCVAGGDETGKCDESCKSPILSCEVFDESREELRGGGRSRSRFAAEGGHHCTPLAVDERKSSTIVVVLIVGNRGGHVPVAILSIAVASWWSCCQGRRSLATACRSL
nr:uncharacterized protein LOC109155151 [Ipomoea batatas]